MHSCHSYTVLLCTTPIVHSYTVLLCTTPIAVMNKPLLPFPGVTYCTFRNDSSTSASPSPVCLSSWTSGCVFTIYGVCLPYMVCVYHIWCVFTMYALSLHLMYIHDYQHISDNKSSLTHTAAELIAPYRRYCCTDLVHLFLEGGEYLIALGECLLKLFKLLRVQRELPTEVRLVHRQLLTALLLLQGLSQ